MKAGLKLQKLHDYRKLVIIRVIYLRELFTYEFDCLSASDDIIQ